MDINLIKGVGPKAVEYFDKMNIYQKTSFTGLVKEVLFF